MDFAAWLNQAWVEHADHAADVAARLAPQGLPLAATDAQRGELAQLAHHVLGAHLGRWQDGRALLGGIAAAVADGNVHAMLQRLRCSLELAEGSLGAAAAAAALSPSDRVRAIAAAAGAAVAHDVDRAGTLLEQALAEADRADLADQDPALRTLAANANDMACELEGRSDRTQAQRALMITAARAARVSWARAGTWLETERAEYRLARTWIQAGDLAQARRHAQACLEIVRENGDAALELFFAWAAMGTVERAAGHVAGHAHALAQATQAFERLDPADAGWCRPSLDALAG